MLTFINIKLPEQGMLLCCNLFHFILNVLALGMALVTKDQKKWVKYTLCSSGAHRPSTVTYTWIHSTYSDMWKMIQEHREGKETDSEVKEAKGNAQERWYLS